MVAIVLSVNFVALMLFMRFTVLAQLRRENVSAESRPADLPFILERGPQLSAVMAIANAAAMLLLGMTWVTQDEEILHHPAAVTAPFVMTWTVISLIVSRQRKDYR